jgi:hypothetical protein
VPGGCAEQILVFFRLHFDSGRFVVGAQQRVIRAAPAAFARLLLVKAV